MTDTIKKDMQLNATVEKEDIKNQSETKSRDDVSNDDRSSEIEAKEESEISGHTRNQSEDQKSSNAADDRPLNSGGSERDDRVSSASRKVSSDDHAQQTSEGEYPNKEEGTESEARENSSEQTEIALDGEKRVNSKNRAETDSKHSEGQIKDSEKEEIRAEDSQAEIADSERQIKSDKNSEAELNDSDKKDKNNAEGDNSTKDVQEHKSESAKGLDKVHDDAVKDKEGSEKVDIDERTTDDEKLERIEHSKNGQEAEAVKIPSKDQSVTGENDEKAKDTNIVSSQSVQTKNLREDGRKGVRRSLFSSKKSKTMIFEKKPINCEEFSVVIANSKKFSSSFIGQLIMRNTNIYVLYTSEKARKHISTKIHEKPINGSRAISNSICEISTLVESLQDLETVIKEIRQFPGTFSALYLLADTTKKQKRLGNADGLEECFFKNNCVHDRVVRELHPKRSVIFYDGSDFEAKRDSMNNPTNKDIYLGKGDNITPEARANARKTVIFNPNSDTPEIPVGAKDLYTDPRIIVWISYLVSVGSRKKHLTDSTGAPIYTTLYCLRPKKKIFSHSFAVSIDSALINDNKNLAEKTFDIPFYDGNQPMRLASNLEFDENTHLAYENILYAIQKGDLNHIPDLIKYFMKEGCIDLKPYSEVRCSNDMQIKKILSATNEGQSNVPIAESGEDVKESREDSKIKEAAKDQDEAESLEKKVQEEDKQNDVEISKKPKEKKSPNSSKIVHSSVKFDKNGNKVVKVFRKYEDGSGYVVKKTFNPELKLIRKQKKTLAIVTPPA